MKEEEDVCKCGDHECPCEDHDGIKTMIQFEGDYAKKDTLMALHAEQAFKLLERTSKFIEHLIGEQGEGTKSTLKEDIDNLIYKVGYNEN